MQCTYTKPGGPRRILKHGPLVQCSRSEESGTLDREARAICGAVRRAWYYPELTVEDVKAVLAYARAAVGRERGHRRKAVSAGLTTKYRSPEVADGLTEARLLPVS